MNTSKVIDKHGRETTMKDVISATMSFWICSRVKGGSASMCASHYEDVELIKAFDRIRALCEVTE